MYWFFRDHFFDLGVTLIRCTLLVTFHQKCFLLYLTHIYFERFILPVNIKHFADRGKIIVFTMILTKVYNMHFQTL